VNFTLGKYVKWSNGFTWTALAELPEEQEFENGSTKDILRTPKTSGFSMLQFFYKTLGASLSLQHIGKQKLEHDTGLPNTLLEETDPFWVLNARVQYRWNIDAGRYAEIFAGIDNITDAYQDDLDKGDTRDAGYIYGPIKPRTYFFGMKVGI